MNKKGFTLIELLAVILILAVIAVIAVPKVLNVVKQARFKAAEDSSYGYVNAIENYKLYASANISELSDKFDEKLVPGNNEVIRCGKPCENEFVQSLVKTIKGKEAEEIKLVFKNGKLSDGTFFVFDGYRCNYDGQKVICGPYKKDTVKIVFEDVTPDPSNPTIPGNPSGENPQNPSNPTTPNKPIDEVVVDECVKLELPQAPTKKYYTFKHWSLEKDGEPIPEGYKACSNVSIYPVYELTTIVAQVGDAKFPTLAHAFKYIKNEGTVLLLKNLTESFDTGSDKKVTLNLNSKTLTGRLLNNCDLKVTNGTMTNGTSNVFINNKKLLIENGNYSCTKNVGIISNAGEVTINSGTFNTATNNVINNKATGIVNIKDGSFTTTYSSGSVISSEGKVTIEKGTFKSNRMVINNKAKTSVLTINGGTFENISSGSNIIANYGTTTINGSPTLNGKSTSYSTITNQPEAILNINGGTINAAVNNAIIAYDKSKVNIKNSRFNGRGTEHTILHMNSGSNVTIENTVMDAKGNGVIYVEPNSNLSITGGIIRNYSLVDDINVLYNAGTVKLNGTSAYSAAPTSAILHNASTGTMELTNVEVKPLEKTTRPIGVYSEGNLKITGGSFTSNEYAVSIVSGTYEESGATFYGEVTDRRR